MDQSLTEKKYKTSICIHPKTHPSTHLSLCCRWCSWGDVLGFLLLSMLFHVETSTLGTAFFRPQQKWVNEWQQRRILYYTMTVYLMRTLPWVVAFIFTIAFSTNFCLIPSVKDYISSCLENIFDNLLNKLFTTVKCLHETKNAI